MKHSSLRQLTYMAVLTAVALTIFVIEAQLPPLAQLDVSQRLVGEIRTLELAELPTFQRTFAQCMLLPEG